MNAFLGAGKIIMYVIATNFTRIYIWMSVSEEFQ